MIQKERHQRQKRMSIWQVFWQAFWTAIAIGVFAFIVWMLYDCARNEEDRDERAIWAIFIFLCGILFAPIYFVRHYLPRRREKSVKAKREE